MGITPWLYQLLLFLILFLFSFLATLPLHYQRSLPFLYRNLRRTHRLLLWLFQPLPSLQQYQGQLPTLYRGKRLQLHQWLQRQPWW